MTLTRDDRSALMVRITDLTCQAHEMHLDRKPWEARLDKCACAYRTGDSAASDTMIVPHSAHAHLRSRLMQKERDALIRKLHDDLAGLPGLMGANTEVEMRFGLTEKGSGAIAIRIDGLPLHPRPVTGPYLSARIEELRACLAKKPDPGPARRWLFGDSFLRAGSPETAIWKWLSFMHRKTVLDHLDSPSETSLALLHELVSGRGSLQELHDPGSTLERATESLSG